MRTCFLAFPIVFVALVSNVRPAVALDREAFTFTNYDLEVRLEPEQQRIGVRGRVSLRNDSAVPQKITVLQISSSLSWRAISAEGKAVQFVSQPYASDIDHTGSLSEAIVTLPRELKPKESVELEIGYEGTIPQDGTRLTRIGTPEANAKSSDWDQISPSFTAVRGVGYVAWYPVAIESASLSEGNSVFEAVARWKAREAAAEGKFTLTRDGDDALLLCNGTPSGAAPAQKGAERVECSYAPFNTTVPAIATAAYDSLQRANVDFYFSPDHKESADGYGSAAEQVLPLITDWFGLPKVRVSVLELPDAGAAPFEAGRLMLMPFSNPDRKLARTTLVHALTHAALASARPWVSEGLAHFMQAVEREQTDGRQSALDYMGLHRAAFLAAEKAVMSAKPDEHVTPQPLVSTFDETYYRSKAMYVWWMLRDMVGEASLKMVVKKYRAGDDKTGAYIEGLVRAESKRDLSWFFDDWVYEDKGLPDFRVDSAFARKTDKGSYLLTVTIANSGKAGAEVPFTVRFEGGEIAQRMEVRGKANATMRVEVPGAPEEIVVNDGSVPESDVSNNTFRMPAQ